MVLVLGYPSFLPTGERAGAWLLTELADRIAHEMGWVALTFAFRGCGASAGDFSLAGWLDDVAAATRHVREHTVNGVWLAGFGTGGSLAICAGAADESIRGVAALGAPADFDDWANNPRRLLLHSRKMGLIRDPEFPPAMDAWSRPLRQISAVNCVAELSPRPLIVMHGADDDLVPVFDARVIGDAHGDAELRIVEGAGHQLRYDPRAVAILLGWLERQRHAVLS